MYQDLCIRTSVYQDLFMGLCLSPSPSCLFCVQVTNGDEEEESKDSTPPIRTEDNVDRDPSDPTHLPAHLPAERRREMWRSAHYVRTS